LEVYNGHRPKLKKLLLNPEIKIIVVGHNDRLMRFGFEYLECALEAQGRKEPKHPSDFLHNFQESFKDQHLQNIDARRLLQ
jgi:hypothetical protein